MKQHGNRNINGIKYENGGTVALYDGYTLLKQRQYLNRGNRVSIQKQWKKDIKNIEPLTNYYFVITPNL